MHPTGPEAHGQLLGTELFDRLAEALGQLTPSAELHCAGAEAEGAEQRQPAQALEDGRAQVLVGLQPVGAADTAGSIVSWGR